MEGMNDCHMPGMRGMTTMAHQHNMKMMHMTFFWGTQSEILFSGWPGGRPGMYALALVFLFALCILIEWLSHCRLVLHAKPGVTANILRSLLHALRMGLTYLVMLTLMSYNGGVFLVALAGHAIGFLAFWKPEEARPLYTGKVTADLPPMSF